MATFLLASHPRPVRRAIDRHRDGLDAGAEEYLTKHQSDLERRVLQRAAAYLAASEGQIALTDSTTMGLGLVYGSIDLRPSDEIVTTTHDFYSTHESLRLRAERTGATVRRVRLYADSQHATEAEILESVRRSLGPRTRVLAVTWVHSSTGVKLPVRRIAEVVAEANRDRGSEERILLCVDGVHGFGNQPEAISALGCDVFVSGCHKWLFGPRGTGLVWIGPRVAGRLHAIIPTFDLRSIGAWIAGAPPTLPPGPALTPGGFHTFEHRWALADAFELHHSIGRRRVAARTAALAQRLKRGLLEVRGVRVRTPAAAALSAGLVCLELDRMSPSAAVELLARHRITASVTPYATQCLRFGPSIANSDTDVDRVIRAVAAIR